MKVLGITGGVGSGKSIVMNYLQNLYNAYSIECDYVGKRLQEPGDVCYHPIIELFGQRVVKADNTLDRKLIARIVFSDATMRDKLNAIVHPMVKARVKELIEKHNGNPLIVIEAALLLEDHYDEVCDEIWYVFCDDDVRRERLKKSRGYSDQRISEMFASQRSNESFRALTQFTIDNSSDDMRDTYDQIDIGLAKLGVSKAF